MRASAIVCLLLAGIAIAGCDRADADIFSADLPAPGLRLSPPHREAAPSDLATIAAPAAIEFKPAARAEHTAVWDTAGQRMLVFGGYGPETKNDTWSLAWTGSSWTWSQLSPAGTPPASSEGHTAVWDATGQRMLVFGGYPRTSRSWSLAWNGSGWKWSELSPVGTAPTGRNGHSAVWDAARQRMLVFGGYNGLGYENDTWELSWNGSNWTWIQLSPTGSLPSGRMGHTAVWDATSQRMLVFGGGFIASNLKNDTWSLNWNGTDWSWAQLSAAGTPPTARGDHAAVWDTAGQRMLVYGGYTGVYSKETWSLTRNGISWAWNELAPTGTPPGAGTGVSAVWDANSQRMLVFGGFANGYKSDTGSLSWNGSNWAWGKVIGLCETTPPIPTLLLPGDGAMVIGCGAMLSWDDVGTRVGYSYVLELDGEPAQRIQASNGGAMQGYLLAAPGLHSWLVRTEGCPGASAASDAHSFTVDSAEAPPPALPILTSRPAGTCSTEAGGPGLEWTVAGPDTRYDVVLNGQVVASDLPGGSYSLPRATTYQPTNIWHVVAKNCAGETQSADGTFTMTSTVVPLAPQITAPANNTTVSCASIVSWTYPGDLGGITFDVVKSDGSVVYASGITATSWIPTGDGLLANGTYAIRVRARNCVGDAANSGPKVFTVDNTPFAPVLQTPTIGQVTNGTPSLSWVVTGAQLAGVVYDVYVDDMATPVASGLTTLSWTVPIGSPLAEGSHAWQVIARGCLDTPAASGSRSFVVDTSPPASFGLTSPNDLTWYADPGVAPLLTWQASSDTPADLAHYRVQLDSAVVSIVDAVTTQYQASGPAVTYSTSFGSTNPGWNLQYAWTLWNSAATCRTGNYCLSGDAGGNYADNADYYATWTHTSGQVLAAGVWLSYYYKVVGIETCCDFLEVQLRYGTGPWQSVAKHNTVTSGWVPVSISLGAGVGQAVDVRFRFYSDYSNHSYDGVYLDDVVIGPQAAGKFGSGLHPWTVVAVDTVGNEQPADQTWSFGIDPDLPASFSLVSPASGAASQDPAPVLEWAAATDALSGISGYQLFIDGALDSEVGDLLTAPPTGALLDGTHSWYVKAKDRAGNLRQSTQTRNFIIDRAPPATVTLVDVAPHGTGDWVSSTVPTFEFGAADSADGSGIAYFRLYIDDLPYGGPDIPVGSGSCGANTCADAYDLISDGPHTWYVEAFDQVGLSTESAAGTFTVETSPPAAFVQTSPENGVTVQTFSPLLCWQATTDAGSGVAGYQVTVQKVGGASVSYSVAPQPGETELCVRAEPPLTNGNYTWSVTAADLAGNTRVANGGAAWTMTIEKDVTPPVATVSKPASDGSLSGCLAAQFTGAASDPGPTVTAPPGSGVTMVDVQVDSTTSGGWTAATLGGTSSDATRPWSWTWAAPQTGSHTIYVRTTDAEGNVQTVLTTRTFNVDCTGPLAFALTSPAEQAQRAACSSFSWAATTDQPAGMGRYELRIQPSAGGAPVVIDAGLSTSRTLVGAECLAQGTYTWSVKAYDTLDNSTDSSSSRTFYVDTSGPVAFPLLTQSPIQPSGWTCNGRSVSVAWSPSTDTGPNGGAGMAAQPYQVYLDGSPFGARTSATNRTFTNLADGPHTWTVRAYDNLDNWTAATVSGSLGGFSVDCTPPGVAETVALRLYANDVPTNPARHTSTPLDTGLDVVAGETLEVTARGELCFTDDASCDPELREYGFCMGPEGNELILGTFSKFYAAFLYGRVTASIAGHEGSPVDVGSGSVLIAPFTGRLLLSANDDDDYNCASKWDEVTVQRESGFNLLFPVNGVVSDDVRPTFEWSAVTDAGVGVDRLEFVLNGNVVDGNLPAGATSFPLPVTSELTEIDNTWKVRAYDALGNVSSSSTWTIRTDLTQPATFSVTTPVEGDVLVSKTPPLCWQGTTDSRSQMAHYLVFLDDQYNTAQYPNQTCIAPAQPLSEGEHCFYVKAQDELRHERTSGNTRCFVVDTLAPDPFALLAPATGETSYTALPEFCWETTDDQGTGVQHYEIWLSGTKVGTVPAPAVSPQPEYLCWTPSAPLPNGPYAWFVNAVDDAGHSASATPWEITIQRDLTPPVVTIVTPAADELYGVGGVPVSGSIVDPTPGTGIARVEVKDAADVNSWTDAELDLETGAWSISWPVDTNGDLTLCARGWDNEGNPSPESGPGSSPCVTVRRDVLPPAAYSLLAPAADAWVTARPTFTWQSTTDQPAGVSHYYLKVAGQNEIDAGTQTAYQLGELEALPDGNYTWTGRAADALGNSRPATGTLSFRVDGLPPKAVTLASPATGTWVNTAKPQLCWDATTDNGASGLQGYTLRIDGQAKPAVPAAQTCYVPTANLAEGDHTWDVQAVDNAGNPGPVSVSRTVRLDLTKPPTPTLAVPDAGAMVKANPPTFFWQQVTDGPVAGPSGVCSYVVTVNGVEQVAASTANKLVWPSVLTDGEMQWSVRAVDCAGNAGADAARTLYLDTKAPAQVVITAPSDGVWTTDTRPTIAWQPSSDVGTGLCSYQVTIDGDEASIEGLVTSYTPSADLDDGLHTLVVRAVDCAGNLSPPSSLSFGVDTSGPQTVVLGEPANGACVGTSGPALSWSPCGDEGSGVAKLDLWVDDALAAANLAPDATTAAATGLAAGAHDWYVVCTDGVGEATASVISTFEVDLAPPGITSVGLELLGGASGSIEVTLEVADAAPCGVGSVEVALDDGEWLSADATTGGKWGLDLGVLDDGAHELRVRAVDSVGNESEPVVYAFDTGQCWIVGACAPGSGTCSTAAPGDLACDDGDACTTEDLCDSGACVGGAPPVCEDGNDCTTDSCDPSTGCVSEFNTNPCDDGNACTDGDACQLGACAAGTPVVCNDLEPCTTDSCDPASGCVNAANTLPCDDGDACTAGDICAAGACTPGGPVDCTDENPCTTESCDATAGCSQAPNSEPCDDSDACTVGDVCSGGACAPGAALNCDDGNPCTTDACDAAVGCTHVDNAEPCDDGDACTDGDACALGACSSGGPVVCDDQNPCTEDSCFPATGCSNADNAEPCNDGDVCTQGDVCAGGSCAAGAAVNCDDDNPCTDDSCDPLTGCVNAPNAAPCDDSDACTEGDSCSSGACTGGTDVNCDDDGNACTATSCDAAVGCVSEPVDGPCDDGDACTEGDVCVDGTCSATPVACGDGNPCTIDACDADLGCHNDLIAGCCSATSDCATGEACDNGSCVDVLCAPCTPTADCGNGALCVALPSGDYCLAACAVPCPEGTSCSSDAGDVCVPDSGDCTCTADAGATCVDGAWVDVDSCGKPGAVLETCVNGCVEASGCCPDGTEAKAGECVATTPIDGDPDAGTPDNEPDAAVSDAGADAESTDTSDPDSTSSDASDDVGPDDTAGELGQDAPASDAVAADSAADTTAPSDNASSETSAEGTSSGGSGGGCSGAPQETPTWPLGLLLVLMAGGWRRRRVPTPSQACRTERG